MKPPLLSNLRMRALFCSALWLGFCSISPRTFADTTDEYLAAIGTQLGSINGNVSDIELLVSAISSTVATAPTATQVADIASNVDSIEYQLKQHLSHLAYLSTIHSDLRDIHSDIGDLPDYSSVLQTISSELTSLKNRNRLDITAFKNANHTDLVALLNAMSAWRTEDHKDSQDQLKAVSNLIEQASSSSDSDTPGFQDVLAGNPWWYTNSMFTVWYGNRTIVQPKDPNNSPMAFTFPEFMSWWSMQLNADAYSGTFASDNPRDSEYWVNKWGLSRQGNTAAARQWKPFTWFDYMAEFQKSNLVYTGTADALGQSYATSISNDVAAQSTADDTAVQNATNEMASASSPDMPDYEPADDADTADADKDTLLDNLERGQNLQHSTRLVLLTPADYRAATGVDGEMVFNLGEGRFAGFVADMSTISRNGWYGLLAVMSAMLFYRKRNEISGIIRGTNFSRVD